MRRRVHCCLTLQHNDASAPQSVSARRPCKQLLDHRTVLYWTLAILVKLRFPFTATNHEITMMGQREPAGVLRVIPTGMYWRENTGCGRRVQACARAHN